MVLLWACIIYRNLTIHVKICKKHTTAKNKMAMNINQCSCHTFQSKTFFYFSPSLSLKPPSLHFSVHLCKHILYTDTPTRVDTGTSVPRLPCPTQASFIPWSGKQLVHCRCSTWVGSRRPFGKRTFRFHSADFRNIPLL